MMGVALFMIAVIGLPWLFLEIVEIFDKHDNRKL